MSEENSTPYHHGDLKSALLTAAEAILVRDGLEKLTLRAVAREVGVSHAAPKNHFNNLADLLSELAAMGFERLASRMAAFVEQADSDVEKRMATGKGYIAFARENPDMFLLIFRRERLDYSNERLGEAAYRAFSMLSAGAERPTDKKGGFSTKEAAFLTARWAMVHGYAMLMIDERLGPILANTSSALTEEELSNLIFNHGPSKP